MLEEEYGYKEMKHDAVCLKQSIEEFMVGQNLPKLNLKTYRWQLIRGTDKKWNADKLQKILGKGKFLRICKVEPDPQKIDNAVRKGDIDLKTIEPALDETPRKPYIKRYDNTEAKGEAEAERVKAAMK